jgi:hypothetical protein
MTLCSTGVFSVFPYWVSKVQGMCHAHAVTPGVFSPASIRSLQSSHFYLSVGFFPLRMAGVDTGLAADAKPGFHINDAIFFSLFNGVCRADRHAPGLLAVKADPLA